MFNKFIFVSFLIFGYSVNAQVDVAVPSSRISSNLNSAETSPDAFEFLASSVNYLNPNSFKWSESTPNFFAESPLLGANYISGHVKYDYIFGFGIAAFRRWGQTEVSGPVLKNEQLGYLTRLRAGYRHHLFQNSYSQVYASATLLPTIFFASESPLGRGETISSFPTQISLGGSIANFMLEGFLENFNEPGFSAGVRIEL